MLASMRISVAVARAVVGASRGCGVPPDDLLPAVGLAPAALDDLAGTRALADFHRLVEAALRLTGEPRLGLRVAEPAPLGMLHVVGPLLANCGSLRETSRRPALANVK